MAYSIKVNSKLSDKVDSDWHRQDGHRAARNKIFHSYIGDAYGLSPPGGNRVPLNGHALYVRSLILYLAAHQPRINITTNVGPWKQHMESIATQASRVMHDQRFGFKQQRWVLDALIYSPGILKIAQEFRTIPIGDEGDTEQVLGTFVSNVDGNDFVWEGSATSLWDAAFVGHRCRIPLDDIIDNPMFRKVDKEVLRGCAGWGVEDSERLFFEDHDQTQPYREIVTCWEVYDRAADCLKIWPVQLPNQELYAERWTGHDNGPLHFLDYLDVPNHPIGLSPLCIIHDLIDATNRALSKTISQTDIAKNIWTITGGNDAEAKAIMEAMDGQGVFKHGGGVTEMLNVPGPDGRTMAMVPVLRDLFNWTGGNINELAGLGVSAPTATQGVQLAQAASGMVRFMDARTDEALNGACEAIVEYELLDEVKTELVPYGLADGSTYWKRFTPEQRNTIKRQLLEISIDPYSKRYRSPEEKLAVLMNWWTQFAGPSFPIAMQQGMNYDLQKFNKTYAKYTDMPEINDMTLYAPQMPSELTGQSAPEPMRQSPVTSRTNIRQDAARPQELGGGLAESLIRSAA